MIIKRSIKFDVEKRKVNDVVRTKNIPLKMRISHGGFTRYDIAISVRIDIEAWNAESQTVHPEFVNAEGRNADWINNILSRYKSFANDAFNLFELVEKRMPTPDEIKNIISEKAVAEGLKNEKQVVEVVSKNNFFDVFDIFTKTTSVMNSWSEGTIRRYSVLKNKLEKFDANLSFETINDDTLIRFMQSMFREKLLNSTINKKIKDTKGFLRWAFKKKYYHGDLHDNFNPKLKGTELVNEPIFFEWNEINYLYNFKIPEDKKHLEQVRDVLCFCAFTSLRHSDVEKLTRSDVKKNHILVVSQKTTDGLKIELNKYSRSILEKYKDCVFEKNRALPVTSNQNTNDLLKELGELAGFNEPTKVVYFIGEQRFEEVYPKYELLSSHVGRKTFVVNSLYLGVPGEVVMKWTGNNDYDALKPYIKIVEELKRNEMVKFDNMKVDKKFTPKFTPENNDI